MDHSTSATVLGGIARAPQWIRHNLDTKDDAIRACAEETLAAMIANALRGGVGEEHEA